MYWKKANQWGGVAAVIGGWGSWALLTWVTVSNLAWAAIRHSVIRRRPESADSFSDEWWCGFWDAVYIASFPAFFISLLLMVVVSLATQKQDAPKPITDVDGNVMDTNPFHYLGIINIKDALRKLRPEEYDD
jgi:Na+/proline symporter